MPQGRRYRCTRCCHYISWPETLVTVGEALDAPIYHEDCARRSGIDPGDAPTTTKSQVARYQMPSYMQVRCARCDDYISWPDRYVAVGEDIDAPSYHEHCAERAGIE